MPEPSVRLPVTLPLDREAVRAYFAVRYEPGDWVQIECYRKPAPPDQHRPDLRLAFQAGQLNERILDQLERINNPPTYSNCYVRTNVLGRRLAERSAKDDDVALFRHLWLDLDHAQAGALAGILAAAGWPPASMIASSGGTGRPDNPGAWAYFKLKEPVSVPAGPAGAACLAYVRAIVRAMLLALHDEPNTATPHRLARIPGTWNTKSPQEHAPVLARIVAQQEEEERWSLDEWARALGVAWDPQPARESSPAAGEARGAAGPHEGPPPEVEPIYAGCAWARQCREQAGQPGDSNTTGTALHEPDWYAWLSIVGRCRDGLTEAERLASQFRVPYPASTLGEKIKHACTAAGPRTCTAVRETLGHAALCDACPHQGHLTSPIQLGYRRRPGSISKEQAFATRLEVLKQATEVGGEAALTAILENRVQLEHLAWLARCEAGQLQAMFDRLVSEYHLKRSRAGEALRTIKEMARQQAGREKAARARDREERDCIRNLLPDAPVAEKAHLPAGWQISPHGVWVEKADRRGMPREELVTSTPMVITGISADTETGVRVVHLAARVRGHWQRLALPRAIIAVAGDIIAPLAAQGWDVHTNNRHDVVGWLAAYEAANGACIPGCEATSVLGWHAAPGGRRRFLLGLTCLTREGTTPADVDQDPVRWPAGGLLFRPAGEGDAHLAAAFHRAGTREGWLAAIAPLADYPLAACAIYAALAAPLMSLLGQDSLILDWADRTSTGKTTALRVAASTCGDHRLLVQPWSATLNSIGGLAAFVRHLPLILDDTKKVRDSDMLIQAIYEFSGGRERPRLDKERKLQTAGEWQTILLSSGEQKVTDFATDQEGGHMRVITVWGRPFIQRNEVTGVVVDQLTVAIGEHYGHALPALLEYVLQHDHELEAWRAELAESRQGFAEAIRQAGILGEHLARRMGSSLAALQVTVRLVHAALSMPWPPFDLWEVLGPAVVEGIQGTDSARVGMELLLEDAVLRRNQYYDGQAMAGITAVPPGGWRGRWDNWPGSTVYFASATVHEVLTRNKLDPRRVVRNWGDNGWILRDGRGKNSVPQRLGNAVSNFLAVPPQVAAEIRGSVEEADRNDEAPGRSGYLPSLSPAALREPPKAQPGGGRP